MAEILLKRRKSSKQPANIKILNVMIIDKLSSHNPILFASVHATGNSFSQNTWHVYNGVFILLVLQA